MADPDKKKDFWDKLSSITPLVLGIAVTGVGAFFTQIYNYRQLQLNQIAALDKLRPLLSSDKAEEREFGYASFAALGYEEIAVRIIQLKKDESGRTLLVELKKSAPPQVKATAGAALQSLDEARKLVRLNETGKTVPDEKMLKEHPELNKPFSSGELWAQNTAKELGITSKLGVAILYDTSVQHGVNRSRTFQTAASAVVPPPLNTREKEKAWLIAFLDQRDISVQQGPAARFSPAIRKRIERMRNLIRDDDWDLKSIADTPDTSGEAGASPPAGR